MIRRGWRKGGSKAIENMLNYIQKSGPDSVTDPATDALEKHIRKIRMDKEVRRSFMTFGDIIDSERREAIEEAGFDPDDYEDLFI